MSSMLKSSEISNWSITQIEVTDLHILIEIISIMVTTVYYGNNSLKF